jgi:hypothetical protein
MNRITCFFILGVLIGLMLWTTDLYPQQFNPGLYPTFEETPTLPGVRGRTIILLPDGGRWVIPPKAMPEGAPAPYYEPPDDDCFDDCHHNKRRHRRQKERRYD